MATTLTDGVTVVTLPDYLTWANEFTTTQVAQDKQRSITGALVIFEDTKLEGRSLSLESDEDGGWITRLDLLALRALGEQEDTDLILVFNNVSYDVRFDRSNGSGIKVVPVLDCSDPSNDSKYALSLSLFTI